MHDLYQTQEVLWPPPMRPEDHSVGSVTRQNQVNNSQGNPKRNSRSRWPIKQMKCSPRYSRSRYLCPQGYLYYDPNHQNGELHRRQK
jgi:hypothetical protein